MAFRNRAETVPKTSELLTSGWSHPGARAKTDGNRSTAIPIKKDAPTTNVLRASSRRDVMIYRPFTKMKHAENSNTAPTTGRGMIIRKALPLGRKTSRQNVAPVA